MTLPQEPNLPLHNPWSVNCYRRSTDEPYDPIAQCPVCNSAYVIDEMPTA